MRTIHVLAALFFIIPALARQQFRTDVPPPKKSLGYELGEQFTSHGRIEKYIQTLKDAAPDRVRLLSYGETNEGRTLYLVVISSSDNLGRLDEIRANIQKLSDPRRISGAEAEKIIGSTPPIAWLSYGVHGNEASSPEAALNVIYQLAARTDDEVTSLLKNLVVVIDPLLNPDGHERYVNFQTTRRGRAPVDDRNAAEHNEDWPSGRSNHYFFDLNRDWAWLTQRESQARIKAYLEWKPQVHVDFHEMGFNSSYFFFPPYKPINKNLPKNVIRWAEMYGQANASAFDAHGWSYWTNDHFDLFYPGYGDSWPSLNGAIGMTYEQAGGGAGVRIKRTVDDDILTLRDRLEHHTTTSFATLKTTAQHREQRLRDFYGFFKDALQEGAAGPVKAYVVSPETDPGRALKMVRLLQRQGVEILRSTESLSLNGLRTYFSDGTTSKKFPVGSYVIPMNQPAKRLITTLMEQEPALSDTMFYDISSWALPVAYGVETYWSAQPVASTSVKPLEREDEPVKGRIVGEKASYAYLLKNASNDALAGLAYLLQHDVKVNVALKEFTLKGEQFPRGSLIIPVAANGPDLESSIKALSETFRLTIYAANTGFTESGITLGSDRAVRLKRPRIIVVTNSPVGSEAFGAIWSMFDAQYGIDFVPMKLSQLRNADLHDYTAIIFPDDNSDGSGYRSQLDSNAVQRIKTWIIGGGTFIGIEGGAAFASASVGKIASIKLKEKKKDEKKKDDSKKPDDKKEAEKKEEKLSDEELEKRMTVEEKERKNRLDEIPGTMMRVKIDRTHPLGFGYDHDAAVLKTTKTMFELSDHGHNVGIYTKSPRLSGYISKENEKMLEETPFLVHEQLGGGNVILFADDPNFRLFFDGLNKLFLNSVLLMPSIRNVSLTSDNE